MAWYNVPNSGTNGKLVKQTQAHDDYPYEEHIRSQPAYIVDGGRRKSSTMSYPDGDGSNNYVVKAERVVEVVRPVVTRRVFVNGNPVKEERIVGAYDGDKGNLDDLGKVTDFFNQVQFEASKPAAPILSRPALNSGTKPNWPSQNDSPSRPNWGSRGAWKSRDDSPTRYREHYEGDRPNTGTRTTYTNYDDSPPRYNRHPLSSTQDLPTKVEDPYKKPSNDNLDDGYSKKSSISPSTNVSSNKAGNTKPNFNVGWYKQPSPPLTSATSNVDDLMRVLEEAKRTGAYPVASEIQHSTTPHWSEITPNPPQGVRPNSYSTITAPHWKEITPNPPPEVHYSAYASQPPVIPTVIDSSEAKRRYRYSQPAATTGYYGTLGSEDAMKIYGGTRIPPN